MTTTEHKTCNRCSIKIDSGNIYPSYFKQRYYVCKNCAISITVDWQKRNKTRRKTKDAQYRERNKHVINIRNRKWIDDNKQKSKDCANRYIEKNRDLISAKNKVARVRLKYETLSFYSNGDPVCNSCGFDNFHALTIDHINGDGNKHRKEIHSHVYSWIKRNNYPCGFQVLCMNCQWIKRFENDELIRK